MNDPEAGGRGPFTDPPAEIRDALVSGIARRRRRDRSRVAMVGGAALLAAAVIATATELSDGPSPALALTIESRGTWVEVEIADADAGAAQMTRELRQAGIDASVRVIPTKPHHVGEWMGFQRVGDGPKGRSADEQRRADPWRHGGIGARGATLTFRRQALARLQAERIVFYIGREPGEGEQPYVLSANGPRLVR
jgi:hypothetical protein